MITASLVLYNTKEDDLRRVLSCANESIIRTIYIIDNSPTDILKKIVNDLSSKCEYIYGQGNIGYGAAHNIGIKRAIEANADYHIVLNPDIYFELAIISELQKFGERHPDVGLILPKVIYPNGELQYLCKLLPTPMDIFGRRLLPNSLMKNRKK